jgi:hypothetical protein
VLLTASQPALGQASQEKEEKAHTADHKRRKTEADLDASFRTVEAALAQAAPPLMHTPESLLSMLLAHPRLGIAFNGSAWSLTSAASVDTEVSTGSLHAQEGSTQPPR